MIITLRNTGKRFNSRWIFREVNYSFEQGNRYVILGPNGSGKSTLLQVIAGYRVTSHGDVTYTEAGKIIPAENHYKHIAVAAPYLELIEEFTLSEQIEFHFKFKACIAGIKAADIPSLIRLEDERGKSIQYFSSGMKQRLRLALAFYSDTSVLLLDEPLSNLDQFGTDWYREVLEKQTSDRLVIICSNQKVEEFEPCEYKICISDFGHSN